MRSSTGPDAARAGDRRSLPVPDGLDGMRLDQAVSRLFGLSRTAAAALVEAGDALVDGLPRPKSDKVAAGSWLEVTLPAPAATPALVAAPVPGLSVVYADDDIVVIDKPVGVAAHPSPGWTGPTVIGGLAAMGHTIATSGAAERQGVVHRLDVGTTGLMVVAKSERAYSVLKRAFKAREVDKHYHAVVQGHLDPLQGTVDAPIDRHPQHDYKWAVVSSGRPSITHYATIEAFPAASLVDIRLETGRTHQIRVHLSALRHPCVGDLTYGADPTLAARLGLTRQWLHARAISFRHPRTAEEVSFVSDYPDDLERALAVLRG
jgi:23S rRNA pseudouridine1911/1915/1917 synthase